MKDGVRNVSATSQFDSILLMLEIEKFLLVRLGAIFISCACIQSGHVNLDIFVRSDRVNGKKKEGNMYWNDLVPYELPSQLLSIQIKNMKSDS